MRRLLNLGNSVMLSLGRRGFPSGFGFNPHGVGDVAGGRLAADADLVGSTLGAPCA